MTEVTPRINAQYLSSFIGQTVRIVGIVTELHGDHATLDARGSITILLNRDCHLALNNAFEILGKVNSNLQVKVLSATDFGSQIDMSLNDAVVDATHRHHEIFYEKSD